jgi:hypothetical protein
MAKSSCCFLDYFKGIFRTLAVNFVAKIAKALAAQFIEQANTFYRLQLLRARWTQHGPLDSTSFPTSLATQGEPRCLHHHLAVNQGLTSIA